MKNKKGFTLNEIIIAVAIIAIVASITIPNLIGIFRRAEDTTIRAELTIIYKAMSSYYLINGVAPQNWEDLKGYIDIRNIKDKYEMSGEDLQ